MSKNFGKPRRQRQKHKRVSNLATQTKVYDLLGHLGNVNANITLNQLLLLSLECQRVLPLAFLSQREMELQMVAVMTNQAIDMSASTLEVEIDDYSFLRC